MPTNTTDQAAPNGNSPMSACSWCSADYATLADRLRAAGWSVNPPGSEPSAPITRVQAWLAAERAAGRCVFDPDDAWIARLLEAADGR